MRKVVLLQSPSRLYDVVPIFHAESQKNRLFDHYYVITDYSGDQLLEADNVTTIKKDHDEQFSTNILDLIEHVPEDIFFFCCEDYIVSPDVSTKAVHDAFDFACSNTDVGFLRLSHNKKVKFADRSHPYAPMSRSYKYYISLQPSVWRKEYMQHCLKRGEDAWKAEIQGTRRALKFKGMHSYGCTTPVFWYENFYKSGKFIRNSYAKYIEENKLDVDTGRKVYVVDRNEKQSVVKLRKWKNEAGNK